MGTITERAGNDAISMLEADHAKMKELLAEYDAARGEAKIPIAERLFEEIELHAKVAKEVLYPIVRSRSRLEGRRLVRAALREQEHLMDLVVSLHEMVTRNGAFTAGMRQMEDAIVRHIISEEEDMLPLAERVLDRDTGSIGDRMLDLRLQLAGAGTPLG